MQNYKKGKNVEEELSEDKISQIFQNLPTNFLWMHVKGGTKVGNVVEFAEKALKSNEYRSVVWSASGGGITKCISCAEIMKRNFTLHQVTRLNYQKIEEYWDPIVNGLEEIVVSRKIPSVHIFLSLDEIDKNTLGYQSPKGTEFWVNAKKPAKQQDTNYLKKRKFPKENRNNSNNKSSN